ncbi:methyl-accepting chemotaxis protein [Emcibacter nanhaiensis]|uniref:HAMP domain-containing protein n=1 Tax=Emcibacter nanhaiensis TaxID=1505037 RepID=A0A501PQA4_9PROT|nr:cache domain-containing protein [Emcibacter nanhaiensis]TPD61966.1 HAMP domain-containing protein [Emcibacter nanhaiensis]
MINRLKVGPKIWLPVVIFTLVLVGLTIFFLSTSKTVMMTDRKDKVRGVVELGYSILDRFQKLEAEGAMSREEAQAAAMLAVKNMRYDGVEYLWINDMHPNMVMHPTKPALDGKDISGFKDPEGVYLFNEMVEVVKRDSKGFVAYMWPKPGFDEPVAKISYVQGFKEWGWIIGSGLYLDDVQDAFNDTLFITLAVAGLGLLVAGIVSVVVARNVTGGLNVLSDTMIRLADGDLAVDVQGGSRQDEVGDMARAVEVFRANAIERVELERQAEKARVEQEEAKRRQQEEKLAAEQQRMEEEQKQKEEAAARRQADRLQMAERFEERVGKVLETVASAAAELNATSESMSSSANNMNRVSLSASKATTDAGQNVQLVAGAAEEMSASIKEIAQRLGNASRSSENAMGLVGNATERVNHMADSSDRINNIIQLIQDIAEQTNLLALNATIEAARAGEAGKGFAVVASEVKNLASQTAAATEDIRRNISEMQESTSGSVAAVEEISLTIKELNEIFAAISASMNEQTAAMQEISSNSLEAANGTETAGRNVTDVSNLAQETEHAASDVLTASDHLSKEAATLQGLVDEFLAEIRAG